MAWLEGFFATVLVIEVPARLRSDDTAAGLLLFGGELFF